MSKGFSSNDRLNKMLTLGGVLVIFGALYWSWDWTAEFEADLSIVYEALITTSVELESLENKSRNLEVATRELQAAGEKKANSEGKSSPVFTDAEIQTLLQDYKVVREQLEEKSSQANSLFQSKQKIFTDVLQLYWGSLLLLVAGVVMTGVGAIFWYYNIKIVKDRRDSPRDGE